MTVMNRGLITIRLLDLIDLFADRITGTTISEINEILECDRRTSYRYLDALEASGWIEKVKKHPHGRGNYQMWIAGDRFERLKKRLSITTDTGGRAG